MTLLLPLVLPQIATERAWVVQQRGEPSFGVTLPLAWTPSVTQGPGRAGTSGFHTADGGRLAVAYAANAAPGAIVGFLKEPRTVRKGRSVLVVRRFVRGAWQGQVSTLRPLLGNAMKPYVGVRMLKGRSAKILTVTSALGSPGMSEAAAIRICERVGP